ncbi:hypothetical protein ES703_45570 [subsurface metagenome]
MHTPYSFSAFETVDQAVRLAVKQNVRIIGVNDFYTTSGYTSWAEACTNFKAFPLFNIEFIGLSKTDQNKSIRINDPNNPGRIYISGKGLSFPFRLEEPFRSQLENLKSESNKHTGFMCEKLNKHLSACGVDIHLDFESIMHSHTKGMIRERHLAKVIREKVFEAVPDDEERKSLLGEIYRGKGVDVEINDHATLENEIRNNLLRSGGHAFIPEQPDSFLSVEAVREIILRGGGIPTYPLLADDKNGTFTEFEQDKYQLADELKRHGIFSIEFISTRNSPEVLDEYATWFSDNGFIVTFGSEHNTPDLTPILLYTRDGSPLSNKMRRINYQGVCMIAAHQYLVAAEGDGYLDAEGHPKYENLEEYQALGNALIQHFLMK